MGEFKVMSVVTIVSKHGNAVTCWCSQSAGVAALVGACMALGSSSFKDMTYDAGNSSCCKWTPLAAPDWQFNCSTGCQQTKTKPRQKDWGWLSLTRSCLHSRVLCH
jgi:hypothetical protein